MSITKEQLGKIEQFVADKLDSLNWQHTQEMRPIARKLAGLEKADKEIVDLAALFHDVGKAGGQHHGHAQKSGEIARRYLEKEGFDQRLIEEAVYCILVHQSPWENQAHLVNTPEAKVLFDADMIQQLSAFGIVKHTIFYGVDIFKDFKKGLIEARDTLFKCYNLILTENGRKMAEEGYKFVKDFYKNLL